MRGLDVGLTVEVSILAAQYPAVGRALDAIAGAPHRNARGGIKNRKTGWRKAERFRGKRGSRARHRQDYREQDDRQLSFPCSNHALANAPFVWKLGRGSRTLSYNSLCAEGPKQPMLDTIFAANPDIRHVQSRCARALFRAGISANLATILAALAGIASGIAFATAHVTFAVAALILSAAFDALDGTIARECAASSPLGGVLDLSADRVVEACVIVGIAWRDPALYFPALILVA